MQSSKGARPRQCRIVFSQCKAMQRFQSSPKTPPSTKHRWARKRAGCGHCYLYLCFSRNWHWRVLGTLAVRSPVWLLSSFAHLRRPLSLAVKCQWKDRLLGQVLAGFSGEKSRAERMRWSPGQSKRMELGRQSRPDLGPWLCFGRLGATTDSAGFLAGYLLGVMEDA